MDGMKFEEDPQAALLDDKARIEAKRQHSIKQREERQKEREESAKKNQEAADKFLAENKAKDGITTTHLNDRFLLNTHVGLKSKGQTIDMQNGL